VQNFTPQNPWPAFYLWSVTTTMWSRTNLPTYQTDTKSNPNPNPNLTLLQNSTH